MKCYIDDCPQSASYFIEFSGGYCPEQECAGHPYCADHTANRRRYGAVDIVTVRSLPAVGAVRIEAHMTGRRTRDCACPWVQHDHGTIHAYNSDECRCELCTVAHGEYERHRRRMVAYGRWQPWTDPTGAVRRLRALAAIGWSFREMGHLLDRPAEEVRRLARGEVNDRIRTAHAQAIAELYDELSMRLPPSTGCNGAVARQIRASREKGWLPPLAYDDDTIDDPDAQPYTDGPETSVLDEVLVERYMEGHAPPVAAGRRAPAERREAIRRLAAKGWDDSEIGRRVGMARDAVLKERTRNGIPAGTPREAA